MKLPTMFKFAFVVVSILIILLVILLPSRINTSREERIDIIKQNTEIIESISEVAKTQYVVSDLLVRVAHYAENHKKGEHMCPECSGSELEFEELEIEEVEEVEETHKQVMLDLSEIEKSIDSLRFGNLNQISKLETMLKRQKNKLTGSK